MKETPLTQKHLELGARMAEFAGYNMPIVYTTIQEEHMAVRDHVGVFDVSHMGEFIVRGKEALDLIQKITSNDAANLKIGDAQYSCMPNKNGGIIDDLLVYRLDEDQCSEDEKAFMLVVNASNIQKDWDWIQDNNDFDARLINISDQAGLLAVQGPEAIKILQSLTDFDLAAIEYYTFKKGPLGGVENVLISATGYTGSGGFEIYAEDKYLPKIWDAIFSVDVNVPIKPVGLGARDTLRLEMGYCLYGNDIDDTTSPLEAGLGWITKTKKEDFNSIDIFRNQRVHGLDKKLVAFIVSDRRVPRNDYGILDQEGNKIGRVTSGTLSPCLQKPIGLGYVNTGFKSIGTRILVDTGKKHLAAEIVRLPFYNKEN
jgi:aminomethyltransferase